MATDLRERLAATTAVVNEARESRRADNDAAYRRMLEVACDGGENDVDEVIRVLADLGISAEQFESDCALLGQRRGWAQVLADGPKHDAELAEHQSAIEQLVCERDKFLYDISAKIHDHCVARDAAASSTGGRAHARMDLTQTAWPHIKAKLASIRAELKSKGEAIPGLLEYIRGLEGAKHASEQTLAAAKSGKGAISKESVKRHQAQLEHVTKELGDATQRRIELQAVVDEAVARLGAAEAEMLIP